MAALTYIYSSLLRAYLCPSCVDGLNRLVFESVIFTCLERQAANPRNPLVPAGWPNSVPASPTPAESGNGYSSGANHSPPWPSISFLLAPWLSVPSSIPRQGRRVRGCRKVSFVIHSRSLDELELWVQLIGQEGDGLQPNISDTHTSPSALITLPIDPIPG
jgi:hypothetical protein